MFCTLSTIEAGDEGLGNSRGVLREVGDSWAEVIHEEAFPQMIGLTENVYVYLDDRVTTLILI